MSGFEVLGVYIGCATSVGTTTTRSAISRVVRYFRCFSSHSVSPPTTFGTFRDYVLQFAGAFGVTESIKGFANTLATVRKV